MADRRVRIAAWAACMLIAVPGFAQFPRGADTLSPRAITDSLAVLKTLDQRVKAQPKDAAAWYRRGMIAWALAIRDAEKPPVSGLDRTRLGRLADTSLRIARQLAPDSTRYGVAAGQFLLNSGWGITRLASKWMYGDAILAARKSLDPAEHAEAAIEQGRVHWRRYDARANRQMELDPGAAPRSMSEAVAPLVRAVDALYGLAGQGTSSDALYSSDGSASLARNTSLPTVSYSNGIATFSSFNDVGLPNLREDLIVGTPQYAFKDAMETFIRLTMALPPDVQGESDYYQAEAYFREAYEAEPRNERTLRNFAMTLVEKARWVELAALARGHLRKFPWDAWGWMCLGLATHRTGDDKASAMAFDSAMVFLTEAERKRLDQLERVLPPADSARVAGMTGAERAAYQRLYWITADPLWAQGNGSPRLEYLSRIAFSELRWTVEELKVRGADTDRGNIFIRYGPPDKIFTIAPDAAHRITDVTTVWIYRSGLMFIFVGPPTWATARFPFSDRAMVGALTEAQPVRWDNISTVQVDSMPFQTARFRTVTDSVDLIVATRPPVTAIAKSAEVAGAVKSYVWWLGGGAVTAARDSGIATQDEASVFRRRVGPGAYLMRAEASTAAARRAGAATAVLIAGPDSVSGFTTTGFGMSDVLIASRITAEPQSPKRWTDFGATPLAGGHSRQTPVTLVWEAYELAQRNNQSQYNIAVTIERERGKGGRVVAEIVDRLAGAVGVDRRDDRVIINFDKAAAASPTLAEHLNVSLAGTPAGTYKLTVTIKDLISGLTTTRTTRLILDE